MAGKLREGFTTGSAATGAALAALQLLRTGTAPAAVPAPAQTPAPDSELVSVPLSASPGAEVSPVKADISDDKTETSKGLETSR